MSTIVQALFNGTAGTDVSAYTPDIGGTFSDTGANQCELDGSGAVQFSAGGAGFWIDVGRADQYVSGQFNAGGADNRVSFDARHDGSTYASRTAYDANVRFASSQILIMKVVSGVGTQLGATVSYTFDTSTTYNIGIRVTGTTIDVLVNESVVATRTDSSISTGNYSSVFHQLRTNGNARLYDFYVKTAGPLGNSNMAGNLASMMGNFVNG